MACESASAPLYSLAFICLSYSFLVLCMHVPSSVSFSFNFSNTTGDNPCGGLELRCYRDAHFDKTTSAIELTKNLRGEITNSQGRVWYKQPVRLWKESTGEVASFTTTFSFNLTPSDSIRCRDTWASQTGDGMAFFLAPWPNSNSSTGGGIVLPNATATEGGDLYLFNPSNHFNATGDNRVVAVEFDTFCNVGIDNSTTQHIGIDVNSIVSVASTNTPGMNNLTSPFTKAAMISYDNVTKMLAVDLQINGTPYALNTTVNLTQSLPETVAVGFSASTGDCVELHQLLSWSFNSTLQEPKLAEVAGAVIKPEPSAKLLLEVRSFSYGGRMQEIAAHVKVPTGVGRVLDAADVRLRGDEAHDRQMERALLVGLWCAHRDPGQRPSIAEAMQVLQSEELKLPVLSLHMYSKLATPPSVGNVASTVVDDSGVSGNSMASGVRSAETAGTTAGSSESFATLPVVLPPHSTW
ncbi:unnamed protein product [Miscanthus lutarioriparius]|uniref:Legume lectin domain-containing protein n=1 Tax=Miscanthus lutarioriparius TaxID=422564 RepID=A0A811QER8_9POAL|nr:unnamed protein product [Miscanthus lutarioriparius]